MKRRYLLLLGATPVVIFLVFIALALTKQREFSKRYAFVELAEKYDITIGTHNAFGPSRCSTAWRIFLEAGEKRKNLSVKDPESDRLVNRVWSYLWLDCYSYEGWNPSKIR